MSAEAAIASGSVKLISQWIVDRLSRKHNAGHLAVDLVRALDTFADGALSAVLDVGEMGADGTRYPRVSAPQLVFPPDADWRLLDAPLAHRLKSLADDVAKEHRALDEFHDPSPERDEFFDNRARAFSRFGRGAILLATELRKLGALLPDPVNELRFRLFETMSRAIPEARPALPFSASLPAALRNFRPPFEAAPLLKWEPRPE